MSVTESQRLLVFERARSKWDEAPAEALMELLPPAGERLATHRTRVHPTLSPATPLRSPERRAAPPPPGPR